MLKHEASSEITTRACFLLKSDQWVLDKWGCNLREHFPNAIGLLHVGSSLLRRDYRDVDVRVVLADDEYDQLKAIINPQVLAVALSVWGQRYTRLPIDCQVQRFSDQKDDPGPRNALGARGVAA